MNTFINRYTQEDKKKFHQPNDIALARKWWPLVENPFRECRIDLILLEVLDQVMPKFLLSLQLGKVLNFEQVHHFPKKHQKYLLYYIIQFFVCENLTNIKLFFQKFSNSFDVQLKFANNCIQSNILMCTFFAFKVKYVIYYLRFELEYKILLEKYPHHPIFHFHFSQNILNISKNKIVCGPY